MRDAGRRLRAWLDWLAAMLVEELAPRPHRFSTSLRLALIATLGIGLMAACHVTNPLGPYLIWLLLGPVAMLSLTRAAADALIEAGFLAAAVMLARIMADTPWFMLPFVGVFTALSTYLIVTRNLGSFGLMIQVVMLDSFYGVIFAPSNAGWAAASLLGGSVIAFGVIALFDGWLWPDPAERILLQSLAASSLRMRARLLETTQYYLGEHVSRPPEPPVSSEMQTQLELLERARAEGVTSHRHAVLLAAISRGARMHNIIDGVIVAAREDVPRGIRTSVRAELRAAADAIGAALDEMAAELPTLIRIGPDEPPPPLAARVNPALAAMEARILAERPRYIRRAGAAELANLGAFIDGLHRLARLLERPLDAPPTRPGVARKLAPASAPDPQMVRYCAKVALCLLAGYVLGLTTQQPAMSVILTTVIVTALPTYGASLRKMTLRIIGGVIGGIVAIGGIIVVTPNFSTLPSYMLVLFVVLFASAYASLASGRIAYAGKQIGTTFVLVFAGLRPSLAIYEPLWRTWGILLGTLIVTVVFFVLWPEYAGDSLMPRLCKVINDTLAAAPGGAAANTIAEIHNTSAEITRLLAEILLVADDARLEGRNSLINYDAVVQSAGTGRRIAHRLAALALQRIENPLPPLDAETQAACDRTIAAIRQRLEEWLAFFGSPLKLDASAAMALAASHSPQAIAEPLAAFNTRLAENGFARINPWSTEQRRQILAELQSLRRLEFLMSELDQYMAAVPGAAPRAFPVRTLRMANI